MDPIGEGSIPFQRLNSNHDLLRFRGYRDFRWVDQGILLLATEYRWPIWVTGNSHNPGLDMLLIADFGQVFHEAGQISLQNMTHSLGFGFEFAGASGLLGRIEFGWSPEESEIRFGLVNLFETGAGMLYQGRGLDREP